jgi:guanylate kinase
MLVTITGPSGVGKTAILERLMRDKMLKIRPFMSTTTRKPKASDADGEYEYLTAPIFRLMQREKIFLWDFPVHGNLYGTRKDIVQTSLLPDFNRLGLLLHEAVVKLHAFAKECRRSDQLRSVYILSPGIDILRQRLLQRGEDLLTAEARLQDCLGWDDVARKSNIPYQFIVDENILSRKVEAVSRNFACR